MSLTTALHSAVSGLRTTQAGIGVVSQNVANAGSVGYTRRTLSPVQTLAGDRTSGVRAGEVQRVLDLVAQRQLRLESSAAGYTGLRADFASALERLFGQPGRAGSLDKAVNDFTTSLQTLAANPGDSATRAAVMDRAQGLASLVAATAEGVQSLRTDAEGRIGAAVQRADGLLQAIQAVNAKIVAPQGRAVDPGLLDERDRLVGELSTLMDLQVTVSETNSVRLSTSAGQTLFDGSLAVRLSFDARTALGPGSTYAPDATRSVGTITARTGAGAPVDLVERGAFRSGEIKAALEMRDEVLVQAQRQLDELAAGLAVALSETRYEGTPTGTGAQAAFPTALAVGDVLSIGYLDSTGTRRDATVVIRGGGAPPPPLPAASDPARGIYVVDPANAASVSALNAALGITFGTAPAAPPATGFTASAANGASTVQALAVSKMGTTGTAPPPASGAWPLFVDAGASDAYGGTHPAALQLTGLAQRLQVNRDIATDPRRLNGTTTLSGDATRANGLLDQLTRTQRAFSPAAAIGGAASTYRAPVADFARRVVETQAADAESAARLDEGQRIALAAIEGRFAETSGVNIDQEMAQLVQLQTAYGANARVMSAVRDLLDMLMRI